MVSLVSSRDCRWRSIALDISARKACGTGYAPYFTHISIHSMQPAILPSCAALLSHGRHKPTRHHIVPMEQEYSTTRRNCSVDTSRATSRENSSGCHKCCRMIATNGRPCQAVTRRHYVTSLASCEHSIVHAQRKPLYWTCRSSALAFMDEPLAQPRPWFRRDGSSCRSPHRLRRRSRARSVVSLRLPTSLAL